MSTQEDIDAMLRKVDGRLAGHKDPTPEGLIYHHVGGNEAREPWQMPLVDEGVSLPLGFANLEDLTRFVDERVRKALDDIAQEFREHPALRPFPLAGEEG